MKRYFIPAVAVAAVVATPIMAHAVTVDFSFAGGNGGTVNGYLVFANPDGVQDPSLIHITSAPAAFQAPLDFFSHSAVYSGAFTLSHGMMKAAYFIAYKNQLYNNNRTYRAEVLDLNRASGNVYYDNTTSIESGPHYSHTTINNTGFSGITFSTVPEPSSLALLGAGLPGIAMFRRRRARASSPPASSPPASS